MIRALKKKVDEVEKLKKVVKDSKINELNVIKKYVDLREDFDEMGEYGYITVNYSKMKEYGYDVYD